MIKLTDRETGEAFDLPAGIVISFERTNPFLSNMGSASLTIALPHTPHNHAMLDWPHRIDRAQLLRMRRDILLTAGSSQEVGTLQIAGFDKNTIRCVILINESEVYQRMGNTQMQDVFTTVRNANAGSLEEQRLAWVYYMEMVMREEIQDDFFVFRVGVREGVIEGDSLNQNGIICLNEFKLGNPDNPYYFGYLRSRRPFMIKEGEDELVEYTAGAYVTPFLKATYILKTIFTYLGYSFDINQLPESFNRLVYLNNTADAIIEGKLFYWQLVPTCTIYTFIASFMKRFGCIFNFSGTRREVTVHFLRDMDTLISEATDLTEYQTDEISADFEERKSISLKCGHSQNIFQSSFSTFEEFLKSHPVYTTYDKWPLTFQLNYPDGEPTYKDIVYFSMLNAFYNVKWSDGVKNDTTGLTGLLKYVPEYTFLFHFAMGDVNSKSGHKELAMDTGDELAANVWKLSSLNDWAQPEDAYIFPIGAKDTRLLNGVFVYATQGAEKDGNEKVIDQCSIMPCFFLGYRNMVDHTLVPPIGIFPIPYGSTENVADLGGYKAVDFSLSFSSPDGIYNTFYKSFDETIQKSYIPVGFQLDLPNYIVNDFNMCLPVVIDGQPIWPERMRYALSADGVRMIEFKGRTLKEYVE